MTSAITSTTSLQADWPAITGVATTHCSRTAAELVQPVPLHGSCFDLTRLTTGARSTPGLAPSNRLDWVDGKFVVRTDQSLSKKGRVLGAAIGFGASVED